ncbi:hypothetical protein LCGC14_2952190, partial [marine sediment metagenome]
GALTTLDVGGNLYVGGGYLGAQGTVTATGLTTLDVGGTIDVGSGYTSTGTLDLGTSATPITAQHLKVANGGGTGNLIGAGNITVSGVSANFIVADGLNGYATTGTITFGDGVNPYTATLAVLPPSGTGTFGVGIDKGLNATITTGTLANLATDSTLTLGTAAGKVDVKVAYNYDNNNGGGVQGTVDLSTGTLNAVNVANLFVGYDQRERTGRHVVRGRLARRLGDHRLGLFLGVFLVGDRALRRIGKDIVERVLGDRQEGHGQILGHLGTIEDLLRHPEGKRGDTRCDRQRQGFIAIGVARLGPPLHFVLAVAHHDDRHVAPGSVDGLRLRTRLHVDTHQEVDATTCALLRRDVGDVERVGREGVVVRQAEDVPN